MGYDSRTSKHEYEKYSKMTDEEIRAEFDIKTKLQDELIAAMRKPKTDSKEVAR
jgi:hypothetical protein